MNRKEFYIYAACLVIGVSLKHLSNRMLIRRVLRVNVDEDVKKLRMELVEYLLVAHARGYNPQEIGEKYRIDMKFIEQISKY